MEPLDEIRSQPAGIRSLDSDHAKADDSSSDESDTKSLYATPTDEFKEVVTAFEDIIDLLCSEPSTSRGQLNRRVRQAKKACQNLLSIVLGWACDVRTDGDSLSINRDDIIGYVVQTSLSQIKSQLRSLVLQDVGAKFVYVIMR